MNAYEIKPNEIKPNEIKPNEIKPNEMGPNEISQNEIKPTDKTLLNYEKSDIFTPDAISKIMASYLLNKGSLLDPCVGKGALLKFIDLDQYDRVDVYDIKENYLKCVSDTYLNKQHFNAHLSDFLGVPPPDPRIKESPETPLYKSGARGCPSNSGARGCPSNSGALGCPSNSDARGCPSNSGARGCPSKSGARGCPSNSDARGCPSNSDARGCPSNSDARGCPSNSGARGCPSNSDARGCPSNSGARGCPSPSNIILNPPFIKIQDLSAEYRDYIKNKWPIFKEGNFDLYFVFLFKCLEMLDEGGVMVAVTPNSYLYNKSAIQLRKYIIDHQLFEKIIDYGSEKIFPSISVYCCITVFSKKPKESFDYNGKIIHYNAVNVQNPSCNIFRIYEISTSSEPRKTLKDICIIKNGIATLRDKIFIHKKKLYDEPSWKEITNAKETKYIIFPYKDGKIIEEEEFKMANPQTFAYLSLHKEELAKRDKGNKVYPKWYSFGRSQSLKLSTSPKVIYIPTFIDPLDMQVKVSSPTLFYSCLCIEPKSLMDDIYLILHTIEKNMELIQQSTSKRGGGWINLSSRILYDLPLD